MNITQPSSDLDEPSTSVLSTSSQTHVEFNNAQSQSPHTKMTAWSAEQADGAALPAEGGVDHNINPAPAVETAQRISDTSQIGRPNISGQSRSDRPPPPKCMQSCIESIESCTQNIVAIQRARRAEPGTGRSATARERRSTPSQEGNDPDGIHHPLLGVRRVRMASLQSSHTAESSRRYSRTRAEGIGLLVGFVILWLMSIWSYIVVISKGPGLVKDYVPESDLSSSGSAGRRMARPTRAPAVLCASSSCTHSDTWSDTCCSSKWPCQRKYAGCVAAISVLQRRSREVRW